VILPSVQIAQASQEQVLGRIARDRELGQDDEVGAGRPRLLDAGEDQPAVSLEVTDRGIDLREREPHSSFSLTVENLRRKHRCGEKLACANLVSANFWMR
jgi:hypothetical protein